MDTVTTTIFYKLGEEQVKDRHTCRVDIPPESLISQIQQTILSPSHSQIMDVLADGSYPLGYSAKRKFQGRTSSLHKIKSDILSILDESEMKKLEALFWNSKKGWARTSYLEDELRAFLKAKALEKKNRHKASVIVTHQTIPEVPTKRKSQGKLSLSNLGRKESKIRTIRHMSIKEQGKPREIFLRRKLTDAELEALNSEKERERMAVLLRDGIEAFEEETEAYRDDEYVPIPAKISQVKKAEIETKRKKDATDDKKTDKRGRGGKQTSRKVSHPPQEEDRRPKTPRTYSVDSSHDIKDMLRRDSKSTFKRGVLAEDDDVMTRALREQLRKIQPMDDENLDDYDDATDDGTRERRGKRDKKGYGSDEKLSREERRMLREEERKKKHKKPHGSTSPSELDEWIKLQEKYKPEKKSLSSTLGRRYSKLSSSRTPSTKATESTSSVKSSKRSSLEEQKPSLDRVRSSKSRWRWAVSKILAAMRGQQKEMEYEQVEKLQQQAPKVVKAPVMQTLVAKLNTLFTHAKKEKKDAPWYARRWDDIGNQKPIYATATVLTSGQTSEMTMQSSVTETSLEQRTDRVTSPKQAVDMTKLAQKIQGVLAGDKKKAKHMRQDRKSTIVSSDMNLDEVQSKPRKKSVEKKRDRGSSLGEREDTRKTSRGKQRDKYDKRSPLLSPVADMRDMLAGPDAERADKRRLKAKFSDDRSEDGAKSGRSSVDQDSEFDLTKLGWFRDDDDESPDEVLKEPEVKEKEAAQRTDTTKRERAEEKGPPKTQPDAAAKKKLHRRRSSSHQSLASKIEKGGAAAKEGATKRSEKRREFQREKRIDSVEMVGQDEEEDDHVRVDARETGSAYVAESGEELTLKDMAFRRGVDFDDRSALKFYESEQDVSRRSLRIAVSPETVSEMHIKREELDVEEVEGKKVRKSRDDALDERQVKVIKEVISKLEKHIIKTGGKVTYEPAEGASPVSRLSPADISPTSKPSLGDDDGRQYSPAEQRSPRLKRRMTSEEVRGPKKGARHRASDVDQVRQPRKRSAKEDEVTDAERYARATTDRRYEKEARAVKDRSALKTRDSEDLAKRGKEPLGYLESEKDFRADDISTESLDRERRTESIKEKEEMRKRRKKYVERDDSEEYIRRDERRESVESLDRDIRRVSPDIRDKKEIRKRRKEYLERAESDEDFRTDKRRESVESLDKESRHRPEKVRDEEEIRKRRRKEYLERAESDEDFRTDKRRESVESLDKERRRRPEKDEEEIRKRRRKEYLERAESDEDFRTDKRRESVESLDKERRHRPEKVRDEEEIRKKRKEYLERAESDEDFKRDKRRESVESLDKERRRRPEKVRDEEEIRKRKIKEYLERAESDEDFKRDKRRESVESLDKERRRRPEKVRDEEEIRKKRKEYLERAKSDEEDFRSDKRWESLESLDKESRHRPEKVRDEEEIRKKRKEYLERAKSDEEDFRSDKRWESLESLDKERRHRPELVRDEEEIRKRRKEQARRVGSREEIRRDERYESDESIGRERRHESKKVRDKEEARKRRKERAGGVDSEEDIRREDKYESRHVRDRGKRTSRHSLDVRFDSKESVDRSRESLTKRSKDIFSDKSSRESFAGGYDSVEPVDRARYRESRRRSRDLGSERPPGASVESPGERRGKRRSVDRDEAEYPIASTSVEREQKEGSSKESVKIPRGEDREELREADKSKEHRATLGVDSTFAERKRSIRTLRRDGSSVHVKKTTEQEEEEEKMLRKEAETRMLQDREHGKRDRKEPREDVDRHEAAGTGSERQVEKGKTMRKRSMRSLDIEESKSPLGKIERERWTEESLSKRKGSERDVAFDSRKHIAAEEEAEWRRKGADDERAALEAERATGRAAERGGLELEERRRPKETTYRETERDERYDADSARYGERRRESAPRGRTPSAIDLDDEAELRAARETEKSDRKKRQKERSERSDSVVSPEKGPARLLRSKSSISVLRKPSRAMDKIPRGPPVPEDEGRKHVAPREKARRAKRVVESETPSSTTRTSSTMESSVPSHRGTLETPTYSSSESSSSGSYSDSRETFRRSKKHKYDELENIDHFPDIEPEDYELEERSSLKKLKLLKSPRISDSIISFVSESPYEYPADWSGTSTTVATPDFNLEEYRQTHAFPKIHKKPLRKRDLEERFRDRLARQRSLRTSLPALIERPIPLQPRLEKAFSGWDIGSKMKSHFMDHLPAIAETAPQLIQSYTPKKLREYKHDHMRKPHQPIINPEEEGVRYVSKFGIEELFEFMVCTLVLNKPENPLDFLIDLTRTIMREMKVRFHVAKVMMTDSPHESPGTPKTYSNSSSSSSPPHMHRDGTTTWSASSSP